MTKINYDDDTELAYVVTANEDHTEGRGKQVLYAICLDLEDAHRHALAAPRIMGVAYSSVIHEVPLNKEFKLHDTPYLSLYGNTANATDPSVHYTPSNDWSNGDPETMGLVKKKKELQKDLKKLEELIRQRQKR
jgi:hypothetical protein